MKRFELFAYKNVLKSLVSGRLILIQNDNKTKFFVLRWFDKVCSENNEVNEEAERKRLEREC